MTQLSKNFTLAEMEFSRTAIRLGIDNSAGPGEIQNLTMLCENTLQPVRDFWGYTKVSSGYRCKELNRAIGGFYNSQHVLGQAADIEVPGISNLIVARWMIDSVDFDQLILEYFTGPINSGWIHISFGPRMRRQVLHKQKGQPYKLGLGR